MNISLLNTLRGGVWLIKSLRFLPVLWCISHSSIREFLDYERGRWYQLLYWKPETGLKGYIHLLMEFPEYRTVLYHRLGKRWLRHFAKPKINLEIDTPNCNIGKGLFIAHGFSTIINASQIGEDCTIFQNVTIGNKSLSNPYEIPTIGNRVTICSGSIVLGEIHIADNSIIGAGSVVVKNIDQPSSIIVPQAPRIL